MYLDSANTDFNEFNADDEVYVGAKLDNKTDAEPLTLDDYASKLAKNPSWTNHGNTRPVPINCSKKKSKITEENSAGENRTWTIPDELYAQLQTNAANYKGDKNERIKVVFADTGRNFRSGERRETYRMGEDGPYSAWTGDFRR